MRFRWDNATSRYVTPELAEKFAKFDGKNCPFCESGDIGCGEDEIVDFGLDGKPGFGYAELVCYKCGSKWPITYQVQKFRINDDFICPNEFLQRDEMAPEDIVEMEKDGWVWDEGGWDCPKDWEFPKGWGCSKESS